MSAASGRGAFWGAVALILLVYSLPLSALLWDFWRTDQFLGEPSLSSWLGRFLSTDDASAIFTSILLPFGAAAMTAVSVNRAAKGRVVTTVALLGLSLALGVVLFVLYGGSEQARINWSMHGISDLAFSNLQSFVRQSVEGIVLFLGMVTGVAVKREKPPKSRANKET